MELILILILEHPWNQVIKTRSYTGAEMFGCIMFLNFVNANSP